MSRLIDAEQAVFDLTHYRDNEGNTHPMDREEVFTTTQIVEWLKRRPTVDAIPVIRCKDCKYAHMTYNGLCKYCEQMKDDDGFCIEVYYDGDHFCDWGERGDNGR